LYLSRKMFSWVVQELNIALRPLCNQHVQCVYAHVTGFSFGAY
jgi:hypothetical protein